jgi:hypothetical protein
VAPTTHQTVSPATLGRNSDSLEGHDTALANLRLARGLVTPSSEVLPRSMAGRPPRARSRLTRGWTPPRARFRLARGHHGLAASIPAPPTEAFNALTFAGAQVKDESTPRRAWESRPGAIPPTPPVRPFPPLCDAVWHGRCQSRDTMPPTLVQLTRRALERGQRNPRRGTDVYSMLTQDYAVTSGQRDRSPPSPSVLCGHPRHANTIPGTASPSPTLWGYRTTRRHHASCCAPYGLSSAAPSIGVRTMTLRRTSTPPPSKPLLGGHRARHDAPPEARFARTAVHSIVLCAIPLHVEARL